MESVHEIIGKGLLTESGCTKNGLPEEDKKESRLVDIYGGQPIRNDMRHLFSQ